MKQNIFRERLGRYIFSFAFLFMVFVKGLGLYSNDWIYKYIVGIIILLIGGSIVLNKYSVKQWIGIFIVGLLSIVVFHNSNDITIVLFSMTVIATKNMDIESIIRKVMYCWNAGLIITVSLALIGIREDVTRLDDKPFIGDVYRHSLGFNSDVALSITVTVGLVLIAYNVKKFYWWKLALLEVFFPALFMITFSYTSVALGMVTVFLVFICKRMQEKDIALSRVVRTIILVASYIPVIVSLPFILANIPWKYIDILNKLCHNRLIIARSFMGYVRPTLFGQVIDTSKATDFWGTGTLDNVYINIYLNWGIVAYILLIGIYCYAAYACYQRKNMQHQIMLMFFMWYGFAELFIRNPFMNVGSLIIGSVIWDRGRFPVPSK